MEVLRELRSQFWYVTSSKEGHEGALMTVAALYSVGGIRTTFTIGVGAGGPAAYWYVGHQSDYVIMLTPV